MKEEPHPHTLPKHHEHPLPTVIHTHEDDTVLARWFRKGVEQGPRFWLSLVGLVAAAVGLGLIANHYMQGSSTGSQAWMDLTIARTPDQQLKVAETYPTSPAARWAELEAASNIYNQAFDNLPTNRNAASPLFKRAYELYSKVYEAAKQVEPPVARLAALGMARTLEASDDLPRAVEQYRFVATTYPGTDEAKRSEALAKALTSKKNVEFYEWLAKYKPTEMTLPPLGRGIIGNDDVPPPFMPSIGGVTPGAVQGGELPTNVFEAPPAPSPTPSPALPPGAALPETTIPSTTPPATPPPSTTPPEAPKAEAPKF